MFEKGYVLGQIVTLISTIAWIKFKEYVAMQELEDEIL